MSYLAVGARILIGLVFLVSCVGKARNANAFGEFTASLRGLVWLPPALGKPAATATVATEAAIVVMVALPATAAIGLGLAVLTLSTFTIGVAFAQRRGGQMACRCFGASENPWTIAHYLRNGLLAAVAVTGLIAVQSGPTTIPAAGLVIAAGVAVAVGAVLIFIDELAFVLGLERN